MLTDDCLKTKWCKAINIKCKMNLKIVCTMHHVRFAVRSTCWVL